MGEFSHIRKGEFWRANRLNRGKTGGYLKGVSDKVLTTASLFFASIADVAAEIITRLLFSDSEELLHHAHVGGLPVVRQAVDEGAAVLLFEDAVVEKDEQTTVV